MEITQKQLFEKWVELKHDVWGLACITQNPLSSISHTESEEWLELCKKFEDKYLNIKKLTIILLNKKVR